MTEAKPSSSTTLDVFAKVAHRYDLANRVLSFGFDQSWRRHAARELRLEPGSTVLDLAAGTGDLAIADVTVGGAARVVATDVSEDMMAFGRDKVARGGLAERIVFRFADAEALPFDDVSFDGVTVGFGVRNFAHRDVAFRQVLRVLRPGGRFVCLEFSTPPSPLLGAVHAAYLRHLVPLVGQAITGERDSYRYLADSIRAFPRQEDLSLALADAGFSRVGYRNLLAGVVAVHVAVR